jgi:outer membrane protein
MTVRFGMFISFAVLVVSLVLCYFSFRNYTEVVFVRSQYVVDNYLGTKEAIKQFEIQKAQWQSNIDSLSFQLQRSITEYNSRKINLTKKEQVEMEQGIDTQKSQLSNYIDAVDRKQQNENDKMMQSLFDQINSFIESYGKELGYEVILGTTASGNILYGDRQLDITEKLLIDLNKHYSGEILQ